MKRVLLIDDELAVASVFETALEAGGYDVVIAVNGKDGLEKAKAGKFDLVLLDQVLGDIPGNDVLKALKQDEGTKNVPVAMLTNFGHDALIKDALNAGAAEYILKYQVSTEDLVKKVGTLLGEAVS